MPHHEAVLPHLGRGQILNMTVFSANTLQPVLSMFNLHTHSVHLHSIYMSPVRSECAGTLTKCLLKGPSLSLLAFEEVHSNWTLSGLDVSIIFATMNVVQCA